MNFVRNEKKRTHLFVRQVNRQVKTADSIDRNIAYVNFKTKYYDYYLLLLLWLLAWSF